MNKKICVTRWRFFFLLFFCSPSVFSQDTLAPVPKLPPQHISFIRESEADNLNTALEENIDSSLSSFHRTRGFLYDITLEKNIFREEEKIPVRNNIVNFSHDIMFPYKFSSRTIRYYNLNRRFTEITYLLGRKKEQLLNVVYTQNLFKRWNVGLDFRRAGADGFFNHQRFYQSSFDVFTHYQSPNERYNLFAYYLRNHLEQQENGGVKDFDPKENTVAQPTYLTSAENKQTDKEFLLRQSFALLKQTFNSALLPDTGKLTVGHKVRYETRGNAYFDNPLDSFYRNTFLDSMTSDSTWYQRWNNELFLELYGADSSGSLSLSILGGHEYFIFKYGDPEILFTSGQRENYYGGAAIEWKNKRSFVTGKMHRYFGDYEKDFDVVLSFSRTLFKDRWKFFINGYKNLTHPPISDIRRYSNHFIWFNDFFPVASQTAEAGIATTNQKFLFSGAYSEKKNMIYYDSISVPRQLDGTISFIKLKLQANFRWRNWILENTIEYQKADNENVIHIPEFSTGHSLSFEKFFFNSALFGRIGMDVRYVSSYYADRYMPALQEFYLQDNEKTAGFALAEFFITL